MEDYKAHWDRLREILQKRMEANDNKVSDAMTAGNTNKYIQLQQESAVLYKTISTMDMVEEGTLQDV